MKTRVQFSLPSGKPSARLNRLSADRSMKTYEAYEWQVYAPVRLNRLSADRSMKTGTEFEFKSGTGDKSQSPFG